MRSKKDRDLPPVEGIVVHGGKEQLNLVGKSLPVSLVLVLEEVLARLLELLGLLVGLLLEDESWLEQTSVNIVVEAGPPVSELRVVLGISVDLLESLLHTVHGLAVGESLNEGSELDGGIGDRWVALDSIGRLGTLLGDNLSVLLVV